MSVRETNIGSAAGHLDPVAQSARDVRHARRRGFLGKTVGVLLVLLFVGAGFGVAWGVVPSDLPAPTPELTRTESGRVAFRIRDAETQALIEQRRYARFGILGAAAVLGLVAGAFAYARLSRVAETDD